MRRILKRNEILQLPKTIVYLTLQFTTNPCLYLLYKKVQDCKETHTIPNYCRILIASVGSVTDTTVKSMDYRPTELPLQPILLLRMVSPHHTSRPIRNYVHSKG